VRIGLACGLRSSPACLGVPAQAEDVVPDPRRRANRDTYHPRRGSAQAERRAPVLPGDAVVADDEAVVFFPAKIADKQHKSLQKAIELFGRI
jgi:hypothetical protein